MSPHIRFKDHDECIDWICHLIEEGFIFFVDDNEDYGGCYIPTRVYHMIPKGVILHYNRGVDELHYEADEGGTTRFAFVTLAFFNLKPFATNRIHYSSLEVNTP